MSAKGHIHADRMIGTIAISRIEVTDPGTGITTGLVESTCYAFSLATTTTIRTQHDQQTSAYSTCVYPISGYFNKEHVA